MSSFIIDKYNETTFEKTKISKLFKETSNNQYATSIEEKVQRLHTMKNGDKQNLYFSKVLPIFARFFVHTLFNIGTTNIIKQINTNIKYKENSDNVQFTSFDAILFGTNENGEIDMKLFEDDTYGLLKTDFSDNERLIDVSSSLDLKVMLMLYINDYNKIYKHFISLNMSSYKAYVASRIVINQIFEKHRYEYSAAFAGKAYYAIRIFLNIYDFLSNESNAFLSKITILDYGN